MYEQKDTIAAITTGSGSGGLGVIRISGQNALNILYKVFLPKKRSSDLNFRPRYMYYGSFVIAKEFYNQDKLFKSKILNEDFRLTEHLNLTDNMNCPDEFMIIDEILAVYFPDPNSYTGEEVVEIHAHGSSILLHNLLEYIILLGARQASAGEFTKRAFLNGRIDLSQAEAVAEIISAPALEGIKLASAKLQGLLGQKITSLREQIEYLRRRLCLAIDFPEEEGECLPHDEFQSLNNQLISDITKLIKAYERAKPWQEGCHVVLAGHVNAGKSSLMNSFLGRKRAIVTAEAGTTRDYLEENTFFNGLPIKLTDTAGLREISLALKHSEQNEIELNQEQRNRLEKFSVSEHNQEISPIELEGIRRSLERIEQADLVLMVFDGHRLINLANKNKLEKPEIIWHTMADELSLLPLQKKYICIWNKADLAPLTLNEKRILEEKLKCSIFCICANPHQIANSTVHEDIQSLDMLTEFVKNTLVKQDISHEEIAPNRRQVNLLNLALQELKILTEEIETLPPDINAVRLESAAQYLTAITGLSSIDETFNAIFAEFCIGK